MAVSYKFKTLGTAGDATTAAENTKAAGIYEAYVAPVGANGNFYTGEVAAPTYAPIRVSAFDFTINKKALYVYVTEDAIEKVYKGANYGLPTYADITFQGLTTADAADADITAAKEEVKAVIEGTATTTVKEAKTYTIIPDVPAASALRTNYNIQAYTSTFEVKPLAITIDPKDMNVAYGDDIDGSFDADATAGTGNVTVTKVTTTDPDIQDGDLATVLSAYNVVVADQTYAAGQTYTGAITLPKKTLNPATEGHPAIIAMLKNFAITEGTGDVIVGNGAYSIVVKNKNITYGDALTWDAFNDYMTPGLAGEAKPASVKFILVNKADATDKYSDGGALPKNAGTYTIKVDAENSSLTVDGYGDPTLVDGELTIAQKPLTFKTALVQAKVGATKAALYTMGASKVTSADLAYETDKILFDLVYVENAVGTTLATNKIALVGGTGADKMDMKNSTPADTYAEGYMVVEPAATDLTGYANANYIIEWNKKGALKVSAGLDLTCEDTDLEKINAFAGMAAADKVDVTINFSKRNSRKLGDKTCPWNAEEWVVLTLPFDISVADLSKVLGYAVVNVIDNTRTKIDVNGRKSEFYGKLTMKGGNGYVDPDDAKKNDTKLAANKPFLVKTADAITGVKEFGQQHIVVPTSADDYSVDAGKGAKFTGTYTAKNVTKADNEKIWFMLSGFQNWSFVGKNNNGSWNIVSTDGYIDMTGVSDAAEIREMTFFFEEEDGTVTAIKSVNAEGAEDAESAEGAAAEGW